MNMIRYNGPGPGRFAGGFCASIKRNRLQGERMIVTAKRSEQPVNNQPGIGVGHRPIRYRAQPGIGYSGNPAPGSGNRYCPRRWTRQVRPACSCAAAIPNHVLVLIDGVRVAVAALEDFLGIAGSGHYKSVLKFVRDRGRALGFGCHRRRSFRIFTCQSQGTTLREPLKDAIAIAVWPVPTATSPFPSVPRIGSVGGILYPRIHADFQFDPDDDWVSRISVPPCPEHRLAPRTLDLNARLATGENEFDQGQSEFLNYSGGLSYLSSSNGDWQWQADCTPSGIDWKPRPHSVWTK